MSDRLADVEIEILQETDKAVRVTDGAVTVWLPKSQVEIADGVATMPEWLAIEKGLV
jgi:hypothetical protein